MISAFVFLFPPLYGEGYGTVGKIINDNFSTILNDSIFFGHSGGMWLLIFVAGGIALAKCVATSATNNGGGVSGNFAPCHGGSYTRSVDGHISYVRDGGCIFLFFSACRYGFGFIRDCQAVYRRQLLFASCRPPQRPDIDYKKT